MLATMAWQAVSGSLSFGRARIQRRQCNMGAAFIHKDQPVRLALLHLLAPAGSLLLVAFAGCQCLFFVSSPHARSSGSSSRYSPASHARFPRADSAFLSGHLGELPIGPPGLPVRRLLSWPDVPASLWASRGLSLAVVSGSP